MSELELELEEPELRAPAWIDSVRLNGVEVDLDRVLASVLIRHGRDDPTGPITSSTASLGLRRIPRAELKAWSVGGEVVIDSTLGLLFTGAITDLTLTADDPRVDAVLSVICASTLARAGSREVGGVRWPAEAWSERMARVLREADLVGVVQPPRTPIPLAASAPSNPDEAPGQWYYASMSALDALEADRAAVGATVFDEADGTLVVQAFEARRDLYPPLVIDPALVLYAPAWSETIDLYNRVVLGFGYGAGSVTVNDPVSQARYGLRWTGLFDSGIADATTAGTIARLWLDRVAVPTWKLPGLTLLEPHPLKIGLMLNLSELPASAPVSTFAAIVEGWVDVIEGPDWTQEVVLSDPTLSGMAAPWEDLDPALVWAGVNPAAAWYEAYRLENLQP